MRRGNTECSGHASMERSRMSVLNGGATDTCRKLPTSEPLRAGLSGVLCLVIAARLCGSLQKAWWATYRSDWLLFSHGTKPDGCSLGGTEVIAVFLLSLARTLSAALSRQSPRTRSSLLAEQYPNVPFQHCHLRDGIKNLFSRCDESSSCSYPNFVPRQNDNRTA